nr:PREDICTED: mitogen-activated protein kinase kinase kinase 6-like [Apteryx mantelli mantelli]
MGQAAPSQAHPRSPSVPVVSLRGPCSLPHPGEVAAGGPELRGRGWRNLGTAGLGSLAPEERGRLPRAAWLESFAQAQLGGFVRWPPRNIIPTAWARSEGAGGWREPLTQLLTAPVRNVSQLRLSLCPDLPCALPQRAEHPPGPPALLLHVGPSRGSRLASPLPGLGCRAGGSGGSGAPFLPVSAAAVPPADVAVVEVSDSICQPSLFYHLGVRESFNMTNNVLLCGRSDLPSLQALQEDICQKNSDLCGSYTFIPYVVTPQNKVVCCDASAMKCLTELFQPGFNTEGFFTPLAGRLAKLLEGIPTNSCGYFRETIRRDIRRARELYRGEQLSRELARIQQRLDSMELLSLDIIINLLLSYRDVQVSRAPLLSCLRSYIQCPDQHRLRQDLLALQTRLRADGLSLRHLHVPLSNFQEAVSAAPDLFCLCGRIYKDMFISSGFADAETRERAFYWYSKAFDVEPSLHSGINSAVLLMAAGHRFETSAQLRQIGVKLNCLQGRKGSLEKLHYYWDVGFCLGAGILANDLSKVIQASEKLYKLNAPGW